MKSRKYSEQTIEWQWTNFPESVRFPFRSGHRVINMSVWLPSCSICHCSGNVLIASRRDRTFHISYEIKSYIYLRVCLQLFSHPLLHGDKLRLRLIYCESHISTGPYTIGSDNLSKLADSRNSSEILATIITYF